MGTILAIDPGNELTAWVLMDVESYRPLSSGKEVNDTVLTRVACMEYDSLAIEMVASYGMPVGVTVFDTCVTIGRVIQIADQKNVPWERIYRRDVKRNLCGVVTAKDSNVIQALADRFAPGAPNRGKGTKGTPGWFFGFKSDIWQAYALGVTWIDRCRRDKEEHT